jgi:hypothetical protein
MQVGIRKYFINAVIWLWLNISCRF